MSFNFNNCIILYLKIIVNTFNNYFTNIGKIRIIKKTKENNNCKYLSQSTKLTYLFLYKINNNELFNI